MRHHLDKRRMPWLSAAVKPARYIDHSPGQTSMSAVIVPTRRLTELI